MSRGKEGWSKAGSGRLEQPRVQVSIGGGSATCGVGEQRPAQGTGEQSTAWDLGEQSTEQGPGEQSTEQGTTQGGVRRTAQRRVWRTAQRGNMEDALLDLSLPQTRCVLTIDGCILEHTCGGSIVHGTMEGSRVQQDPWRWRRNRRIPGIGEETGGYGV